MASTGQGWEIVGKPTKKKTVPQSLTKSQKKSFIENMPRIEASDPVKESHTIYEAFMEKPSSNGSSNKASKDQMNLKVNGNNENYAVQKKNTQNKKKQSAEKKYEKAISLEEAMKKIDCKELERVLLKGQETFPDNPSLWLKDLASILNMRLDKVEEVNPLFDGKPNDYPVSSLPKAVRQLITKTLRECSTGILELFLEHCITSMNAELGKGLSTYGYRIFIQLIAHDKPEIAASSLPKYLEMLKSLQNRPLRCLSIMWAVGQAGVTSLACGLKVWMELMVPVLNVRALANYSVEYLDSLFKSHKNVKQAYGTVATKKFFPILDLIYGSNTHLPSNLQKKLQSLYPQLKAITFGKNPENNLRTFFPSFLARLVPHANIAMKNELLKCLVECLVVDKHCFSIWRQMYVKLMGPSSLLLEHLVKNWDSVSSKLEKKLLRETINAFSVTNDELVSQEKNGVEGYQKCVSACKELLIKMSSMRFPWKLLILLILSIFASVVAYDVYSSGSFKKSQTSKFLKDAGILVFLEQVWMRIKIYSGKAILWSQENLPIYYAKTCEFVGPYLQLFWEKMYTFGLWLVEVTKDQRMWLNQKIPELLAWFEEKVPWLHSTSSYYLSVVWEFTVYYSLWLWHHIVYLTQTVTDWLLENVFKGSLAPEKIFETLSTCLQTIQSYIVAAIQSILELLTDAVRETDTPADVPLQTGSSKPLKSN